MHYTAPEGSALSTGFFWISVQQGRSSGFAVRRSNLLALSNLAK
jgi:hypothetical protein